MHGYCYQVSNQKLLIEEWLAVLAFSDMAGYSVKYYNAGFEITAS